MRAATLTLRHFGYEMKMFRRTPAAMFFVVVLPVLLLVTFATLYGTQRLSGFGRVRFSQYYVPTMAAFGLMTSCYANLAGRFVYRRETGTLERFRGSPVPLVALIGGFLAFSVAVGSAVCAVNVSIGAAFYGVSIPDHLLAYLLFLVVGAASFCAMGVAIASVIPDLDSADPIIWGTLFPLLFISGTFSPISTASPLHRLASIFPIQHLTNAALTAFGNQHPGPGIAWADLAVIAAWGTAGLVVALRRFRWTPARN